MKDREDIQKQIAWAHSLDLLVTKLQNAGNHLSPSESERIGKELSVYAQKLLKIGDLDREETIAVITQGLKGLAKGVAYTTNEVATKTGMPLSIRTIGAYLGKIHQKLGVARMDPQERLSYEPHWIILPQTNEPFTLEKQEKVPRWLQERIALEGYHFLVERKDVKNYFEGKEWCIGKNKVTKREHSEWEARREEIYDLVGKAPGMRKIDTSKGRQVLYHPAQMRLVQKIEDL